MTPESTIGSPARPLRIVIAGGGTGGHVSPAVAVLDELRTRMTIDPLWIGSRRGFERDTAERLAIPYKAIQVGKLRRYVAPQTVIDAARIPFGVVQAWRILRRNRPDIVFSTGGYVSAPPVIAASRLGIPTATHEQTASIGLATRINARFADLVALSYERSRPALGRTRATVVVTGNPVRDLIFNGDCRAAMERFGLPGELPLVYITGGALGSRAINAVVADALTGLLHHSEILHQSGPRSSNSDIDMLLDRASRLPADLRRRYCVVERVGPEIGDIFAAAALVVGRAGAGTIAELAAVGLPSILIPLPGAEEQRQNALFLAEGGAALMIPQDELDPSRLAESIIDLIANPDRLQAMRKSARRLAAHDPAGRLVDALLSLLDDRVA